MVIRTMRSATTLKISSGNTANLTIVSLLSYKHGMYLLVMSVTFKSFGNIQSCSLYYPVISLSIALSISLTLLLFLKTLLCLFSSLSFHGHADSMCLRLGPSALSSHQPLNSLVLNFLMHVKPPKGIILPRPSKPLNNWQLLGSAPASLRTRPRPGLDVLTPLPWDGQPMYWNDYEFQLERWLVLRVSPCHTGARAQAFPTLASYRYFP